MAPAAMPVQLGAPAETWLPKTVALGKVPEAVVVVKTLAGPVAHLTAAAPHSRVVLELVELEVVAGTPAVAAVAEQTTIHAAPMPVAVAVGLHMQTRRL